MASAIWILYHLYVYGSSQLNAQANFTSGETNLVLKSNIILFTVLNTTNFTSTKTEVFWGLCFFKEVMFWITSLLHQHFLSDRFL
jgi:hypothetical protein